MFTRLSWRSRLISGLITHSRTAGSARCSVNGTRKTRLGESCPGGFAFRTSIRDLFVRAARTTHSWIGYGVLCFCDENMTHGSRVWERSGVGRRATAALGGWLASCVSGASARGDAAATPAHHSTPHHLQYWPTNASFLHFTSLTSYEVSFEKSPNSILPIEIGHVYASWNTPMILVRLFFSNKVGSGYR